VNIRKAPCLQRRDEIVVAAGELSQARRWPICSGRVAASVERTSVKQIIVNALQACLKTPRKESK
jgi:hypothetical protein